MSNKEFLYNYYYHLSDNKLTNNLGICGYTAISMFLSYYDTYWDDNFIPENYDSDSSKVLSTNLYSHSNYNSPGINNTLAESTNISNLKNEIKKRGITDESSEVFKEALDNSLMQIILDEIKKDSFAGKLFSIALENKSIKPHYTIESYDPKSTKPKIVQNIEYLSGIGVNYDIMNSMINNYVNQNENINGKVSIVTSRLENNSDSEKARLRNEIVTLVKKGKPVIMGGNGFTDKNGNGIRDTYPPLEDGSSNPNNEVGFGHVAVAYDYDEVNDILYGNMGWGPSNNHRNLDKYFNDFMADYWSFDISDSLPQTYTNNYYFTDENATYYPFEESVYNTLSPAEYEFPEAYASEEIISSIHLPSSNKYNSVEFKRYRCGYIEEECINLSPRKIGCNEAYLEYKFARNVKKILVDLSFWSAKEFTNDYNSKYRIEYLLDGKFMPLIDLWVDVNLPTDRTNPLQVEANFPNGTTTFRFYSSSMYTSDRNKGRLSIFDMMIIYETV